MIEVYPVLEAWLFARLNFRNRGVVHSRHRSCLERGCVKQDVARVVEGRSWADTMRLVCWAFLLVKARGLIVWLGHLSGVNSFSRGLSVL